MSASEVRDAADEVGIEHYLMLIGDTWCEADEGARLDSVNPYTSKVWATTPSAGPADVDRAVAAARAALDGGWRATLPADRARMLRRLGDLVGERIDELTRSQVNENGRLGHEVRGQTEALRGYCYYYAGIAETLSGRTLPSQGPGLFAYTVREPVGVVAAVIPWNSPLALLIWKLGPALAAGNTIVVKPSETTPVSALEFVKLVLEAGFPPGVVNVVTGEREAGAHLVAHPGVDKVAFTGSTATGRLIASAAGAQLTRVTLELGGKSPNIVFADADLEAALTGVLRGAFGGAGQSCMAGSRVLIQEDIYHDFSTKLVERVRALRLGDPMDPSTQIGTMANRAQYDKVLRYIDTGLSEGAALLAGGAVPADPALADGLFIEPTVFGDVGNAMTIARDEIFGPVVCLLRFADEAQALDIANDTAFGLAAGVWTNDLNRAQRMASRLHAGTVWINTYRNTGYGVPFGGVGDSGLGRENGPDAIDEYTEIKTVWINTSGA
ncbi:aldehyde dehydrogenase (NAD+) [Sinosporangium album]|uniref:Aldehyde dehydrogenase (NAD+) n=1 Tax=Sinosporangium album TaxID=504805 RepID=A0A1G7ZUJ1_9ACTN|nr:aldehyde dehydrogenase [Sinosporangium album]SDH12333.1 aldehyde dehydrogenase (NAD+) [Sinosporangium album]